MKPKKESKESKDTELFSKIDGENQSSSKLYYEVLIFSQEGGLQQVTIVHEEGDQYANEISDRILSSVELQNTKQ